MSPIGELSGSHRIALEVSTAEGDVMDAKAGGAPSPTKTTPNTREDAPIRFPMDLVDFVMCSPKGFIWIFQYFTRTLWLLGYPIGFKVYRGCEREGDLRNFSIAKDGLATCFG